MSRQLYYPFGESRWSSAAMPTDFGFTGQREQSTIGLYDYHARFYDPYLGRFISADSIIPDPGNPQAFNRYSYVNNRPLVYIDPSGHWYYDPGCDCLAQTDTGYNEYPWYTDYAVNLPPPVPDKYKDAFIDAEEELRTRWAYAIYWKEPKRYTYDAEIWELAFHYYSYSAHAYDLQLPWYTPPGYAPFYVRTIAEVGSWAQPTANPIHFDTNRGLGGLSFKGLNEGQAPALGGGPGNGSDWSELSGMLRNAVSGKGNFGIGEATSEQTEALGRAWVGENYRTASDGRILISADGVRQYRPPTFKPKLGKMQANFEWRLQPQGQWQGNAHVDVVNP